MSQSPAVLTEGASEPSNNNKTILEHMVIFVAQFPAAATVFGADNFGYVSHT